MANIDEAIYTVAQADAGLVALVGARFYCERAPDTPSRPYVVFWCVTQDNVLAAHNRNPVTVRWWEYQFDCYAETRAETRALRQAVHDAFVGYTGNGITSAILVNQRSAPEDQMVTKLHHHIVEIQFGESIT
jgi:hypothetical protein